MPVDFSAYLVQVEAGTQDNIFYNNSLDWTKWADNQHNIKSEWTDSNNNMSRQEGIDNIACDSQTESAKHRHVLPQRNVKDFTSYDSKGIRKCKTYSSNLYDCYSTITTPSSRVHGGRQWSPPPTVPNSGLMIERLSQILRKTAVIPSCDHCLENKRSNSLPPSWKTKKRKVSFADDLGLPLKTVRVFEKSREDLLAFITVVPHDKFIQQTPETEDANHNHVEKELVAGFDQPASNLCGFLEKIDKCNVSLENVKITGTEFLGTVRVRNISFHKHVYIRYTCNRWDTYDDVTATYVPKTDNVLHVHDMFSFQISVDASMTSQVEFAICYRTQNGEEFWDSNDGHNYRLDVVMATPTVARR